MISSSRPRLALALAMLTVFSRSALPAPADVDLLFDAGSGIDGEVRSILALPDGKILIGGHFTTVRGLTRNGVARLHPDGRGDATFAPGVMLPAVNVLARQPDGKILVAGSGIVRLNVDGTQDPSFDAEGLLDGLWNGQSGGYIQSMTLQTDGKVVLGRTIVGAQGDFQSRVNRLHSDGSLDAGFTQTNNFTGAFVGTPLHSVALQADGKVLVTGDLNAVNGQTRRGLVRLNADGTLDTSFQQIDFLFAFAIAVQPDSKLIVEVAPAPNTFNWGIRSIVRLHPDGMADPSFDPTGTDLAGTRIILPQANAKLLVGGDFGLVRLNGDGSRDETLGGSPEGTAPVRTLAVDANDNILFAGDYRHRHRLARLTPLGEVDSSLKSSDGLDGTVTSIASQLDGKLIVGGLFTKGITRLNADGSADPAFDPGSGVNSSTDAVVLQPDGRILLAGSFSLVNGTARPSIARLMPDGSLDPSFNPIETVPAISSLAVQPNGKILVSPFWAAALRLNADGSRDESFQAAGSGSRALALQPDGRVLVGRNRLHPDGLLDVSFNADHLTGSIYAIALQPDGRVLFGTVEDTDEGDGQVVRCHPDGSRDASFLNPIMNGEVRSVVLQPDGKILVGGEFDGRLVRLHPDGSLDSSFAERFLCDYTDIAALLVQPDGKVLVGGGFSQIQGVARAFVARLSGGPEVSLGSLSRLDGLLEFQITRMLPRTVAVEASTNLVNWSAVQSFPVGTGPVRFIDPDQASFPRRFYRVSWAP